MAEWGLERRKKGIPGQGPSTGKSAEGTAEEVCWAVSGPWNPPPPPRERPHSAKAWCLAQFCLCLCRQTLANPQGQDFSRTQRATLCVEFCLSSLCSALPPAEEEAASGELHCPGFSLEKRVAGPSLPSFSALHLMCVSSSFLTRSPVACPPLPFQRCGVLGA